MNNELQTSIIMAKISIPILLFSENVKERCQVVRALNQNPLSPSSVLPGPSDTIIVLLYLTLTLTVYFSSLVSFKIAN